MNCKVKLFEGGVIPSKKSESDACYDMYARSVEVVNSNLVKVYLGVALAPEVGYRVAIYPRSSISKTGWMLANSVGVGDNNYRGEYMAYFVKVSGKSCGLSPCSVEADAWEDHFSPDAEDLFSVGDRVAQMELVRYNSVEFQEVEDLGSTDRGAGGFGSTGKR